MACLTRISTTVVKGTSLDHPEAIEVGQFGYAHDRLFHFIDDRGVMFSSKRHGPLVQVHSKYDDDTEVLTLNFPDGDVISAPIKLTDEHVSTNFWGRPVDATIVDGPFADAVGTYVGRPLRMVRADVPGTATDLHPVTLIATATLDHFASKFDAPTEHWRDRFRMLFEVDGLEPFEEETWEGATVTIGDLDICVQGPIPRCLVTRQNPRTGLKDFETLKALRKFRTEPMGTRFAPAADREDVGGFLIGMYATVAKPGKAHRDDEVTVSRG